MTKTISTTVTALSLTAAVVLTAAYANASTPRTVSAAAAITNTAQLCPVVVRVWNLESNRVGNARTAAARNKAFTDWTTSTRDLAELSTDPALKKDLAYVADGMTRIGTEPGDDVFERTAHLTRTAPDHDAAIDAASDRIEATCGTVTGEL